MKKRIVILSTLFFLTISLLIGGLTAVRFIPNSGQSDQINVSDTQKINPLKAVEKIELDVAEEVDFNDDLEKGFIDSITEEEIAALSYTLEDDSIVYLTKNKHKIIGLQSGETKLTISSDKYHAEINIIVKEKNFCTDYDFEADDFVVGTKWTAGNQKQAGWTLYTSKGNAAISEDQIVEIAEEDGNKFMHFKHTSATQYTNLYKSFLVEPGQYYVTAKMKGVDVEKDTYVRVNQGGKLGLTQTQKIKGSFDWQEFKSEIVRIPEEQRDANGNLFMKVELYFALNSGEVWFDDIEIHRIITTDYTSFTVEKPVEKLAVGGTSQIICETYPESVVDYQYYYEVEDSSVVTVDALGNVKGLKAGVSKVVVKDSLYNYKKEVLIIVGEENAISASFNDGETMMVVEDSTTTFTIDVEDTTDYVLYKYSEALYGNYYIDGKKIVYSPKADYYSLDGVNDSFTVIVFDATKGYALVNINVEILGTDDDITYVEFWHTTDKDSTITWGEEKSGNYYAVVSGKDYNADAYKADQTTVTGNLNVYGGGYLQVESEDIEALYPSIYKKDLGTAGIVKKTALYKNLSATGVDGSLQFVTKQGGTVTIRLNGVVQEIHDRYYDSQGKIIYGVLYDYTPAEGFTGYDHFYLSVLNGSKFITVENTVYVAPSLAEFKFDELDLSGVYLLTNDQWLKEVRDGYKNGDPYITKWIEYYAAQYAIHVPAGVPADARTPMEQLAILYQVTGEDKYFQQCWSEIEPVVKDEWYSEKYLNDATGRRLSWGQDSNGFLDAAMVTYSVAFAYNFIKDKLTADQKLIVMKALYEEGFYYFENLTNVNVLLHGNNHNLLVCGDLAVAALSAMSYEGTIDVNTRDHGAQTVNVKEMAAETVATAFKYLQIGLVHYAENGGFPEGPSYSIYAHRNMVSLLSTLNNIYGKDANGNIYSFGLSEIEGILNYINYPLYSSSPNYESFYYAESEYSNNQPALLWYTRLDESNYNAALLSKLADENEQYNIQALLYYKPGLFERVDASKINELDYLLDEHELATFRSAFGNEMAVFTGLKGTNSDSGAFAHRNLDSGTFELYALGERFIGNFSNETYNVVVPDGYWDYDYQRWTYYKKGAQGHNTLLFNPEKNPVIQQDPNEKAKIVRFESNANSGLSVIDLSRVYKSDAINVQRGLKLFNNRTTVMVQDEFKLRDYSTVYWSAHTEARIEILNEKVARLTLNGKSIYAVIQSDLGSFSYTTANAPLPGTQGDFCNLDNDGVNKLMIKLEEVLEGTLCVTFVPTLEEISKLNSYKVTPIDEWTLDKEVKKTELTVENIEVAAETGKGYKYIFNPRQYEYVVKLAETVNKVPDLNVTYDETKYEVTVQKSATFNNLTKVIVKDKATGEKSTYNYKFIVDTKIGGYEEYLVNQVVNVSGHTNAANIIDGENGTMLNSNSVETIVFELAEPTKITDLLIRFAGGVINTYYFDVYASVDGENYTCVYFGGQSSNGLGDEVYTLGVVEAKYIKIVFNGEIRNDKLSVIDVKFLTNSAALTVEEPKKHGCGGGCSGSIITSIAGIGVLGLVACFMKRKKEENELGE